MRPGVVFQVIFAVESSPADITLERRLSRVGSDVGFQVGLLAEAYPARVAFIRLLSGVRPGMGCQVLLLVEPLPADFTFELASHPSVSSVLLQTHRVRANLSADGTGIRVTRHQSGVRAGVGLQVVLLAKNLCRRSRTRTASRRCASCCGTLGAASC